MIRRLVTLLALALAAPALAQPVKVEGGTIDGIVLPSGVKAWLGVPFAAPPLRELRWKPPQPVAPWQGTYHADRFAPECLQPLRSPRQNHYFGNEATSEDCLYLNIWAPRAGKKLPVVVWIYGGAYFVGSASAPNYSGEPLAQAGVVRVNLSYRVGSLGWLAHPELSRESGYGGSGNYGLMDQIAALRWVRRNIAQFGGDPANVTIVGQSAGAQSIGMLQASPEAHGLFDKAAAFSGSGTAGLLGPVPLAIAEESGLALQRELGASSLAAMRAIPGDRIVASGLPRRTFVADGKYLTGPVEAAFASGKFNDVPVLTGFTLNESFQPFGTIATREELAERVRARFPGQADALLAAYAGLPPQQAAAEIARDTDAGRMSLTWATAQRTFGTKPAFTYLFTRRQPYAPGVTFCDHDPARVGAYHAGDIPYWLRTRASLNLLRTTRIWEPIDEAIEAEMSGALLSFARTGVPVSRKLGRWPAFVPDRPKLVVLGEQPAIADWPHAEVVSRIPVASVPMPLTFGQCAIE